MFKPTQSPTYWATVRAEIAAENGGRGIAEFDVKFKRLSVTELKAMKERVDTDSKYDDAAIVREIVLDWKNIVEDDGSQMPFNDVNLERVLDAGMGGPIGAAFWSSLTKAKLKN